MSSFVIFGRKIFGLLSFLCLRAFSVMRNRLLGYDWLSAPVPDQQWTTCSGWTMHNSFDVVWLRTLYTVQVRTWTSSSASSSVSNDSACTTAVGVPTGHALRGMSIYGDHPIRCIERYLLPCCRDACFPLARARQTILHLWVGANTKSCGTHIKKSMNNEYLRLWWDYRRRFLLSREDNHHVRTHETTYGFGVRLRMINQFLKLVYLRK